MACASALGATWIGSWATAPLAEPAEKEKLPLAGATLRQVVHVSLGGENVRLRLSNAFGESPLVIAGAHLALAAKAGAIDPATDHVLTFGGRPSVSIPAGACYLSDPIGFSIPPLADVAISLRVDRAPATLTVHGGARTTSYLESGDALAVAELTAPVTFTRWYFINGLDIATDAAGAGAVVMLGDSITDGYGSTTDANNRWPDDFARLLGARPELPPIGVLNLGIGGNRLLRDGLGPNALARFDRDVLGQSGARWLLVFEGINDIGTRLAARKQGADYASAGDIIDALGQVAARAHGRGLRVIAATITPYAGADFYWSSDGEADRQTINQWIRTGGVFDAVVDFDAAIRDPEQPQRIAAPYDSGDHLHPSAAGYRHLAESFDPALLAR